MSDAVRAFVDAWEALHEMPIPGQPRNARRLAARMVADAAKRELSRVVMPITQHFDWDRLRVNVAHKVSPAIVKWKAAGK